MFSCMRQELSCWKDNCVLRGLYTAIPGVLHACVLSLAQEGHLGFVELKQRCRDLVWWPGMDRDIEALVEDCAACLVSGKTGHLPPALPTASPLALSALVSPTAGRLR